MIFALGENDDEPEADFRFNARSSRTIATGSYFCLLPFPVPPQATNETFIAF
jgi:hypothetical protein